MTLLGLLSSGVAHPDCWLQHTWYSWNMGSYTVLRSAEEETYDQSNQLRSSKCY